MFDYVAAMAGLGLAEGDIMLLVALGAGLLSGASKRRLHLLTWTSVVAVVALGVAIRVFVGRPLEAFTDWSEPIPIWMFFAEWIFVVGLIAWALYLWVNPHDMGKQVAQILLPGEEPLSGSEDTEEITVRSVLLAGGRGVGNVVARSGWGPFVVAAAIALMMVPDPPFLMAVALSAGEPASTSPIGYAAFATMSLLPAIAATVMALRWDFVQSLRSVRTWIIRYSVWFSRISALLAVGVATFIGLHAMRNWPF
ncbi:MAG: hypothetical protein Q4P71_07640 [Actinomycetaceae bacterium]|nr:hypothetical protein [Actinomycetaceae bacterium]